MLIAIRFIVGFTCTVLYSINVLSTRYNRGISSKSSKKPILAVSNFEDVKEEKLPPEAMEVLIKELKSQLAYEKMRSESFLKMIEIAERELKIDIRKKSGAKQSLK